MVYLRGSSHFCLPEILSIVTGVVRLEPSLEWIQVRDRGLSERPDAEVLAYAAEHGYLVVSHDVNTMPRATYDRIRSGQQMSGLLMVTQREPIGPVIASILLIWSASEAEDMII